LRASSEKIDLGPLINKSVELDQPPDVNENAEVAIKEEDEDDAERTGEANVCSGFMYAYRYHMGSLALGPFVIAILKFIQVAFVYPARLGTQLNANNPLTGAIVSTSFCILHCFEEMTD